tara:strand:- start:178 stop:495 length:318 start_codon:yes stop_codon:yes gene_type:complete
MSKMSDLHLTYMEHRYLVHDGFKHWLIDIESSRSQLNYMILTDVLENDTDLHAAKYNVLEKYFLPFLENYISVAPPSMSAEDLWNMHEDAHEKCLEEFEEFLRNV